MAVKNSDELCSARLCAFLFQVMFKRGDDCRRVNWCWRFGECPIQIEQVPPALPLKHRAHFRAQHLVNVKAFDVGLDWLLAEWKAEWHFHDCAMRFAFSHVRFDNDFEHPVRLNY